MLVAAGLTRFTASPRESCPAVAPDVPVTVAAPPSVQAGRVVTRDVCNMTSECGCLHLTWVVGERWGVIPNVSAPHLRTLSPISPFSGVKWDGMEWNGVKWGGMG